VRSAGLSCSHDTCYIDGEVGSLFNESVPEHLRRNRVGRCRAAFLYSAKLFASTRYMGSSLFSDNFSDQCLPKSASLRGFPD
jgi:hypothetical protein